MSDIKGQRIVVIGGSSGIGLGVAKEAVALGADVTIVSRSAEKLQQAAKSIGGNVQTATLDATDEQAVEAFFENIEPFDHLVCSMHDSSKATMAGAFVSIEQSNTADCSKFMQSKFWSQFHCAKHAVKKLTENGSITLTSGIASKHFVWGHALVAGVNAAVDAFAKMFAREIGPKRVNVVCPGLVRTPTLDALPNDEKSRLLEHVSANLPINDIAVPKDIAGAYLYLMQSPYHTADIITLDGGYSPGLDAQNH